jgi:hypothetical protein
MKDPLRDRQQDTPDAYCDYCDGEIFGMAWISPHMQGFYCCEEHAMRAALKWLQFYKEDIGDD